MLRTVAGAEAEAEAEEDGCGVAASSTHFAAIQATLLTKSKSNRILVILIKEGDQRLQVSGEKEKGGRFWI